MAPPSPHGQHTSNFMRTSPTMISRRSGNLGYRTGSASLHGYSHSTCLTLERSSHARTSSTTTAPCVLAPPRTEITSSSHAPRHKQSGTRSASRHPPSTARMYGLRAYMHAPRRVMHICHDSDYVTNLGRLKLCNL
jgi:hypothetical protein